MLLEELSLSPLQVFWWQQILSFSTGLLLDLWGLFFISFYLTTCVTLVTMESVISAVSFAGP